LVTFRQWNHWNSETFFVLNRVMCIRYGRTLDPLLINRIIWVQTPLRFTFGVHYIFNRREFSHNCLPRDSLTNPLTSRLYIVQTYITISNTCRPTLFSVQCWPTLYTVQCSCRAYSRSMTSVDINRGHRSRHDNTHPGEWVLF